MLHWLGCRGRSLLALHDNVAHFLCFLMTLCCSSSTISSLAQRARHAADLDLDLDLMFLFKSVVIYGRDAKYRYVNDGRDFNKVCAVDMN